MVVSHLSFDELYCRIPLSVSDALTSDNSCIDLAVKSTPDCEPIVICFALRLVVFDSLPPTVATLETTPFMLIL